MNLKYVKNLSQSEADIYLYSEIGDWGVNASEFINELRYITENLGIQNVNVRIASPGGSVIDGLAIYSAIRSNPANITTYIDGIVASIATLISLAGDKTIIASYGAMMIHNAHVPAYDYLDAEEQKKVDNALAIINQSLASIITDKSGMTNDEVVDAMNKETWYTASQALELKLVDEISDYKKERMAAAQMNIILNQLKPNKMTEVKALLNLAETADEATILASINGMKQEVESLKNKVAELETENDTLKTEVENAPKSDEIEALKEKVATVEVENAIALGKIKASEKDAMVKVAKDTPDAFRTMINAVEVKAVSISKEINNNAVTGRESWTIRDWEKNDPTGLSKMMTENKAEYERLFNAYYKK